MPHVTFIPFTGFRIREDEMLQLGMSLPGLRKRGEAIGELPALGLLTLAGMTPDSWTCRYLPATTIDDAFLDEVLSDRPDLVAVTALTASVLDAYAFARRLRAEGIPVVLGGLHATVLPEEARAHVDGVIVGDGEAVWQEVLSDASANSLRPIYRADKTEARFEWPLPRYDLMNSPPPRFTLQTQRGCPFACEFCGASRLLGRFREKPVQRIQEELAAIRRIDPRPVIELADDNTFAGSRDADELLDVLAESGARWFTESDWRIGERPAITNRLADAGCVQVLVGIESLVFRYPGMGAKQAELDRIMNAVVALQDAGVAVNGCCIIGAEGETRQSIDRLVDFLLAAPFADVQLTLQTPFPGTALYEQLRRESRLLPECDWSHFTLFDVTYRPDRLTPAELRRGFRDAVQRVFSPEATRRRERIRLQTWHQNGRLRP